jgi:hypothetical protein
MESKALPPEMQVALAGFDAECSNYLDTSIAPLAGQPAPDVLYHYTNDAGLRGILETGKFWLTDIFYLNDPSELQHGLSVAADVLTREAEILDLPKSNTFVKNFVEFLKTGIESTAHYFVGSFSIDGDDLGQWRAYADNGRGFALGFDGKQMEEEFITSGSNSTFYVSYDTGDLAYRFTSLALFALKALTTQINTESDNALTEYMKQLSILLSIHVLRTALLFKHHAYHAEVEFRFLEIFRRDRPVESMQYRQRGYELIKYREFAWRGQKHGLLKQVVIGPAADPIKARRFVKDCLTAFHINQPQEVEIVQSPIPYRAVG